MIPVAKRNAKPEREWPFRDDVLWPAAISQKINGISPPNVVRRVSQTALVGTTVLQVVALTGVY